MMRVVCLQLAGLVGLLGQVRGVEERETSTAYQLEDRTGRIEVVLWHQEDQPREQPEARETLVKVVGELRSGASSPT